MRRKENVQDQAHALLLEWAGGVEVASGVGYPEQEMDTPVSNQRADLTSPERYAHKHYRWHRLDRAVSHVHRMSRELGEALRDHYEHGFNSIDCAKRAGFVTQEQTDQQAMNGVKSWRRRLVTARAAFLATYTVPLQDGVDEYSKAV